MKRLLVDLKENCNGEIQGRISHPEDSVFVLDALVLVLQQFSKACDVTPTEIARDLYYLTAKEERNEQANPIRH